METKFSSTTAAHQGGGDGIFINSLNETMETFRICKILETEVRVWGSIGTSLDRQTTNALRQIIRFAQPTHAVALMADYHPAQFGVVGSVVVSAKEIVPDLIGGDCGCGVYASRLGVSRNLLYKDRAAKLLQHVLQRTPVGKAQNRAMNRRVAQLSIWQNLEQAKFLSKREIGRLKLQLGSLGGGNHFIEIGTDSDDQLWLLVHSGSRFLGGLLKALYYERKLALADQAAQEFLHAQSLCLLFAALSRKELALRAIECMQEVLGIEVVQEFELDQPHNFIELAELNGEQVAIHRKGACAANKDVWGCIPGNMASGACVVQGKASPESYCSASHGAGRVLSRGEASRELTYKDLQREMQRVTWSESRKLIDEAPQAYKKLEQVMRAQSDLVRVRFRLRPIISIKGEQ